MISLSAMQPSALLDTGSSCWSSSSPEGTTSLASLLNSSAFPTHIQRAGWWNGIAVPFHEADIWIHCNQPGQRDVFLPGAEPFPLRIRSGGSLQVLPCRRINVLPAVSGFRSRTCRRALSTYSISAELRDERFMGTKFLKNEKGTTGKPAARAVGQRCMARYNGAGQWLRAFVDERTARLVGVRVSRRAAAHFPGPRLLVGG